MQLEQLTWDGHHYFGLMVFALMLCIAVYRGRKATRKIPSLKTQTVGLLAPVLIGGSFIHICGSMIYPVYLMETGIRWDYLINDALAMMVYMTAEMLVIYYFRKWINAKNFLIILCVLSVYGYIAYNVFGTTEIDTQTGIEWYNNFYFNYIPNWIVWFLEFHLFFFKPKGDYRYPENIVKVYERGVIIDDS